MKRRTLLGGLGGLAVGGGAGYLFSDELDLAIFGRIRDCPQPDDQTKLPVSARLAGGWLIDSSSMQSSPVLITSERELSVLRTGELSESMQAFVNGVDFDDSFLLAVELGESTETKGIHFAGVERRDDTGVNSYSCVTHPGTFWFLPIETGIEAGLAMYTFLAKVQADFQPEFVRHTHRSMGVTVMESE